jgi:hypothetical protein
VVGNAYESSRFAGSLLTRGSVRLGYLLALVGALLAASGCRKKTHAHGTAPASALNAPKLSPLSAKSWLVELELPGFGNAALAVPQGATDARPIVIALHSAADRPEWACGAWRGIAGPTPFILCPRGEARSDFPASDPRYTFGDAARVAAELRAGLAALKREFGAHVASGAVVFAGFQLGADRVAEIAQQEPTFFARLALVDPAPSTWPTSEAALFGREGGDRVLFACGPAGRAGVDFKAVLTRRGGADARAVFLGERPPALDAATVNLLRGEWPWLSAPVKRLAPAENLVGNPLAAKRPELPRQP